MGTPPRINFWCELLLVLSISRSSLLFLLPLGLMLFLAVVFSSVLYLAPQSLPRGSLPPHPMVASSKDLALLLVHLTSLALYTVRLTVL